MQDDEIMLLNACTDLVGSRKREAFPMSLLTTRQAGEWVPVRDICQQIDLPSDDFGPTLSVTWLPDPTADESYVVILFFDDETKWSLAAQYNRARLLGGTSVNGAPRAADTATSFR
jgi:hypothetical protein